MSEWEKSFSQAANTWTEIHLTEPAKVLLSPPGDVSKNPLTWHSGKKKSLLEDSLEVNVPFAFCIKWNWLHVHVKVRVFYGSQVSATYWCPFFFFSYNTGFLWTHFVFLSSGSFAWHTASFLKPFRDHSYQRICAAEGSSFTLRQSALPWQALVYNLQNIFHTIKLQVNKACWEDLGHRWLMGKIILIFVLYQMHI